jgi:hypothetical protein
MLYKVDSKQKCKFLLHKNKGLHKLWIRTEQVESNVQLLIDLSVDTMPHKLKGIRNGRHDVRQLLPNTWRSLRKQNDEVSDSVYN